MSTDKYIHSDKGAIYSNVQANEAANEGSHGVNDAERRFVKCVIIFVHDDAAAQFRNVAKEDGVCVDGAVAMALVIAPRDITMRLLELFKNEIKKYGFDKDSLTAIN